MTRQALRFLSARCIATGEKTIEKLGRELFHFMLDMTNGRKKAWAERWKLYNALVLLKPAPVI